VPSVREGQACRRARSSMLARTPKEGVAPVRSPSRQMLTARERECGTPSTLPLIAGSLRSQHQAPMATPERQVSGVFRLFGDAAAMGSEVPFLTTPRTRFG
jgi:hypothetical protein